MPEVKLLALSPDASLPAAYENQAPVVQKQDSHLVNHYQMDNLYKKKNNCVIYWIAIFPMDSAIHLVNNRRQASKSSF